MYNNTLPNIPKLIGGNRGQSDHRYDYDSSRDGSWNHNNEPWKDTAHDDWERDNRHNDIILDVNPLSEQSESHDMYDDLPGSTGPSGSSGYDGLAISKRLRIDFLNESDLDNLLDQQREYDSDSRKGRWMRNHGYELDVGQQPMAEAKDMKVGRKNVDMIKSGSTDLIGSKSGHFPLTGMNSSNVEKTLFFKKDNGKLYLFGINRGEENDYREIIGHAEQFNKLVDGDRNRFQSTRSRGQQPLCVIS